MPRATRVGYPRSDRIKIGHRRTGVGPSTTYKPATATFWAPKLALAVAQQLVDIRRISGVWWDRAGQGGADEYGIHTPSAYPRPGLSTPRYPDPPVLLAAGKPCSPAKLLQRGARHP